MGEHGDQKHHMLMFPWVGYGHLTPFLHLSNKLAARGHKVSFLLPKSAQLKLHQLNQHPLLITFFPILIPHVHGLPPGAETTADVPYNLEKYLLTAFDQTQDQVRSYIRDLKPDFVFYDDAYWVPSLARDMSHGTKFISYSVGNTVISAFHFVPSRSNDGGDTPTVEVLMKPPPGFPSSRIQVAREDASVSQQVFFEKRYSNGELSKYGRIIRSIRGSDAVALRTCHEIEGPFCDYVSEQFAKPVLLTGPAMPETASMELEEKWANWLGKFETGSVVYCAFGSQMILEKDQFQELIMGFELTNLPFLVALKPPHGCSTIEEALPEGFHKRVGERGWVYGGWVPQPLIINHTSVGCFVSHCGFGSLWESLLSHCQLVLIPCMFDQIFGSKLVVEELKVAVEVERGENRWVSKESLCRAIKLVMAKDSAVGGELKRNHDKLRNTLRSHNLLENYIDTFIQDLQQLTDSSHKN